MGQMIVLRRGGECVTEFSLCRGLKKCKKSMHFLNVKINFSAAPCSFTHFPSFF